MYVGCVAAITHCRQLLIIHMKPYVSKFKCSSSAFLIQRRIIRIFSMSTSFIHASASVAFYPRLYLPIACAFSILAVAYTLSCSCDYSCPDVSVCAHGTVKDLCGCCDICGLGLDARCGGPHSVYGKCGDGLVCNINWTIPAELRPDGRCIREVHQVNMTNPNSSSTENATTTTITTSSSTENATTTAITTPTPTPTTNLSTEECRESCSVEFCSNRARICSARGMEYSRVQARTPCQHTSCRACFLLVRANCTACPEPPNKKCLRRYHECVRDHYHRSAVDDVFLRLEDRRARSAEGQVFCHIPEVGTWSEPDSH